MLRIGIIIIFFFNQYISLRAQKADSLYWKREYGLGFTNIPAFFVPYGKWQGYKKNFEYDFAFAKIVFTYKKPLYNNRSFRFGLSPRFGFARNSNARFFEIETNMGYERNFYSKNKKICFLAGGDVLLGYGKAFVFKIKSKEYLLGTGPVIGIRYMFSQKFSLLTETGIFIAHKWQRSNYSVYNNNHWFLSTHRLLSLHINYHF